MLNLILSSMISLKDLSEELGYIVAVGTAIGAIYYTVKRYLWNPVYAYFNKISSSLEQISTINNKIGNIAKELTTNGGSSIKDVVLRMDKNLFLLEERQKAILSSSKEICYFETDENGSVITVNRYFQQVTSRSIEELLGFGWLNVVDENERENVRKEWQRCIDNAEEYSAFFFIQSLSGTKHQVKLEAYPMKHKDKKLAGYVALMKPISRKT